jgi:copper(I)-binding protein
MDYTYIRIATIAENNTMINRLILAALLSPVVALADQCMSMPIEFSDGYAVTTSSNDEQLNAFITVRSHDPVNSHTITDVSTPSARIAQFQAYARDSNDTNPTGIADEIVIPPEGLFIFRPRNISIMIDGYKDRPNPGDMISLTFTFGDDCTQTVNNIPVKSPDEE